VERALRAAVDGELAFPAAGGARREGCTYTGAGAARHVAGEFSAAFKNSPMKRAKLRGLKRCAAVVLSNSGAAAHTESAEAFTRALDDPEPLPSADSGQAVREHAAWALQRLRG